MTRNLDKKGVENLANAIIIQAVSDYRYAERKLAKNPNDELAKWDLESIKRFFYSHWFSILTNLSGSMLLSELQKKGLCYGNN